MTPHDHTEYVQGCFRCDLSRTETAPTGTEATTARCESACDYCKPDAWHDCTLPAGHDGYHSCTGYVA